MQVAREPYRPRSDQRRRGQLLTGHQALACAVALRAGPRPGRILLRNVYGWFERTQPGTYRLTGLGEAALQRWAGSALCESATESR